MLDNVAVAGTAGGATSLDERGNKGSKKVVRVGAKRLTLTCWEAGYPPVMRQS